MVRQKTCDFYLVVLLEHYIVLYGLHYWGKNKWQQLSGIYNKQKEKKKKKK